VDHGYINRKNLERIELLSKTTGKNSKIELARTHLDDPDFVQLVRDTYNPFRQYKIKKIKSLAMAVKAPESIIAFLDEMVEKDAASNQDIARAGIIVQSLGDPELAVLFSKVLKKDLKVGMNVNSWNLAGYGIPDFKIQLAHSQSHIEKFLEENTNEFILQTKFDGNRAIFMDGNKLISRNGHEIKSCDFHIQHLIEMMPPNTILDGEILHDSLNLQQCQSIVSKKDSSHGREKELTYQIFDIWMLDGTDVKSMPLGERMKLIQSLPTNSHIVAAPYDIWTPSIGNAKTYIELRFQDALGAGHEGLILKSPSSIYEGKRSRNWVKIKERDNLDLEVLELVEGEAGDKFEGMMGAVTCELNGKRFNVGTGWKENERKQYWEDPNSLIGRTIEISYWKLSPDGIPLHPAIVRIREDK
jgi:DNA ligase 1